MSGSAEPVARVVIGGLACGTATAIELEASAYRRAGTFRATLALDLSDPAVGFLLASGANPSALVPVTIDLALGDPSIAAWVPMFVGTIDELEHDVGAGLLTVSGRDATATLIDLVVTDQFLNQTSSDVVSTLASRAGLSGNISPTATFTGQYYQIDHARNALSSFTRFANAWEILCALADLEGFECWVSNGTLNFVPSASAVGQVAAIDIVALQSGVSNPLGLTRLRLERRLAIDAGVGVKVRSWNSRQKTVVEQTVPATGGDNATMVFVVPNATDEVALKKAASLYRDVARHGRAIAADMAGELALSPRDLLSLTGTAGGGWDGTYVVDLVTRRIDPHAGFEQSFVAHALIST